MSKGSSQEKARKYIEEHNIEKTISEMLNSLVHFKDQKPIVFMVSQICLKFQIKFLANLATKEELKQAGIEITGALPTRIPLMTFPKFSDDCSSLLKKHLTRDMWSQLKKRQTPLGGNIQLSIKSGVSNASDPIGVFATDEEAYKVFDDLLGPIIRDLHPDYDLKYSFKDEFDISKLDDKLKKIQAWSSKIDKISVQARRNFKEIPFAPLINKEAKANVEKRASEILGDLFGEYQSVRNISEQDKALLEGYGVTVDQTEQHDKAGFNDDWPLGRGVFLDNNKSFAVLVNFDDHINIITLGNDLFANVQKLQQVLQPFETKMGYAKDTQLGYLSTSPQHLGTGLKLTAILNISGANAATLNEIGGNLSCQVTNIGEGKVQITHEKTLASNLTQEGALVMFADCIERVASLEDAGATASVNASAVVENVVSENPTQADQAKESEPVAEATEAQNNPTQDSQPAEQTDAKPDDELNQAKPEDSPQAETQEEKPKEEEQPKEESAAAPTSSEEAKQFEVKKVVQDALSEAGDREEAKDEASRVETQVDANETLQTEANEESKAPQASAPESTPPAEELKPPASAGGLSSTSKVEAKAEEEEVQKVSDKEEAQKVETDAEDNQTVVSQDDKK